MPQPYPSRLQSPTERAFSPDRWAADASWPPHASAPDRQSLPKRSGESAERRKPPAEDARTPDDKDGNEQLKRQKEGKVEKKLPNHDVPSRKATGAPASGQFHSARGDMETEDTGEWVASRAFTLEDEVEDTWPNLPPQYLDD